MIKGKRNYYHVVTNDQGMVLGVYGEALLSEAQELCRKVKYTTGCNTYLHLSLKRVHVGDMMDMKGFSI